MKQCIKHYKGVALKLESTKGRVRTLGTSRRSLKVGQGTTRRACLVVVKVGILSFHSEYSAKRFIKALEC